MVGRYLSPLRYPGGKAKVSNFIKLVMLQNNLVGSEYVEPYAGGASVALSLLFEDYADHIHINDINRGIYAFWHAVLYETKDLCARVETTSVTIEEWYRQRELYRDPNTSGLELAFATFYLNRTNRSGIISRGGVIGGLDQTGPWKIDARYNGEDLARRIAKISRFRSRITLTNEDAADLLRKWVEQPHVRALVYLDPPYYVKGSDLYDNFYTHEDHKEIAGLVAQLPQSWLVSYDAAPEIIDMYSGESLRRYGLRYSASTRIQGAEVLASSPDLVLPDEAPAAVSARAVSKAQMFAAAH